MKYTHLLITAVLAAAPSKCQWTNHGKIIDVCCTHFEVVTELNLIKFLCDVGNNATEQLANLLLNARARMSHYCKWPPTLIVYIAMQLSYPH